MKPPIHVNNEAVRSSLEIFIAVRIGQESLPKMKLEVKMSVYPEVFQLLC